MFIAFGFFSHRVSLSIGYYQHRRLIAGCELHSGLFFFCITNLCMTLSSNIIVLVFYWQKQCALISVQCCGYFQQFASFFQFNNVKEGKCYHSAQLHFKHILHPCDKYRSLIVFKMSAKDLEVWKTSASNCIEMQFYIHSKASKCLYDILQETS